MTAHTFYRSMVLDHIVNDASVIAYAVRTEPKKRFAWRRILIPALSALALVFGVTFAIPQARAEVLSWFSVQSTRDYLAADPSERPDTKPLENMLAPANPDNGQIVILQPSDALASDAKALADRLQADFSATLGETLYDGKHAYVKLHLSGFGGSPAFEETLGGTATALRVDPYKVYSLYENGPGEAYLSGEKPLYQRPFAMLLFTFADGTECYGMPEPADQNVLYALTEALDQKGLLKEELSESEQAEKNALLWSYYSEHGYDALVSLVQASEAIERNAAADGFSEATVTYSLFVIEDAEAPATELMTASLGTIRFNAFGYRSMETVQGKASETRVSLSGETIITRERHVWDDPEAAIGHVEVENYAVSLDGLTLEAMDGAYIDALGVHNLRVLITPPEGLSEAEMEAFLSAPPFNPIDFRILVNGQEGNYRYGAYYGNDAENMGGERTEDGKLIFVLGSVSGIPLEELDSVRSITLIPYTRHIATYAIDDGSPVAMPVGEQVTYPAGSSFHATFATTLYPDAALTFQMR